MKNRTTASTVRVSIVLAASLALLCGQAIAHTFTVQSTRYVVSENSSKPMMIGWGHYLPLDDATYGKKIKFLNIISPDGEKKAIQPEQEPGLHSYMIDYDRPGTWALAADTNPGYYAVYKDKRGKEHHALKPKTKIKRAVSFKLSRYTSQSSKAYIRCGENAGAFQPLTGLDLELVPEKNPTLLKQGEKLNLTVYYKGEKETREGTWDLSYVGFSREANAWYIAGRKASEGKFSVTPDREGIWFIRYQLIREATPEESKLCDEFCHKTTMVFQVGPSPSKKKGH